MTEVMPLKLFWIIWSSVSWAVELSISLSVFSITFGIVLKIIWKENILDMQYTYWGFPVNEYSQ